METITTKHFVPGRPDENEFAKYYALYVSRVASDDVISVLKNQIEETRKLFASIPEEKGSHRYADGKWSIKELAGHLIDAERVMAYRALWFARGNESPISGMEQDDFVKHSRSDDFPLSELISEFVSLRESTVFFFKHLDTSAWARRGIASDCEVSVRALAYIIAGHLEHHFAILKERYLD